ncbi:MAG: UDP-N-acetylmuramate dehydrogenase [bacterium]
MFNSELICKEIEKWGLKKEIKIDELMKYHTSWKIGGVADFFCIPTDEDRLKKVISFASKHELPIYIIGNGSNIWVPDEGIRGLVVKLSGTLDKIEYSGKMIKTGAGILLPALVRKTVEKELSGLEFAAHIPGTLGGAVFNNASFGNKSMADIVRKIVVLDYNDNTIEIDTDQSIFFYRGLDLGIKKYIILATYLEMVEASKNRIISRIKNFYNQRKTNQPIESLTAGCIFKNTEKQPAGFLIEKSGAKGLSIGDAQVSEKHANFIINRGKATSKDILLLIEEVEKKLRKLSE